MRDSTGIPFRMKESKDYGTSGAGSSSVLYGTAETPKLLAGGRGDDMLPCCTVDGLRGRDSSRVTRVPCYPFCSQSCRQQISTPENTTPEGKTLKGTSIYFRFPGKHRYCCLLMFHAFPEGVARGMLVSNRSRLLPAVDPSL